MTRRDRLTAGGPLRHWLALALAAILGLLLVETALLTRAHPPIILPLDVRSGDLLASGLHAPEDDGGQFRWTTGDTRIALPRPAGDGALVLRIDLGAPAIAPTSLTIAIGERAPLALLPGTAPRRYLLLVPDAAARRGALAIRLSGPVVTIPPDTRQVHVRLRALTLDRVGATLRWPEPWLLAFQSVLLLAATWLAWRVGLRGRWLALPPLGMALLGGAAALAEPALAPLYLERLLAVGVAPLIAITAIGLPQLERRAPLWMADAPTIRCLWGIALLGCALRLVGTLYPPFSAYDLSLNLGRLIAVIEGTLVATNRSFEFRGGVTVYPPGPYLTFLPALLLPGATPKLVVQGGIALVDGWGCLAIGALALRLGVARGGALLAALLYAALPIALTSLWWGHTAQVFGQALMAPLLLALLAGCERGGRWPWVLAAVMLCIALLTHIGVAIIAVAWLGLAWLPLRGTVRGDVWRSATVMGLVALLVGGLLVYGPAAALKFQEIGKVTGTIAARGSAPAYNLIWRAVQISYAEIGWALALPGALVFARRLPSRPGALLIAAWGATAAVFWLVEMLTALQVRYLVFLGPLVCLVVGALLAQLMRRGRLGMVLGAAMLGLMLWYGSWAWLMGIHQNVQMSMIPLLR